MTGQALFVTGTDTGVGKTVATAALATALVDAGRTVAVYKPTQAGLDQGGGDIDVVAHLAGLDAVHEGIRLRHPMAPVAAAEREGVFLPAADEHRARIGELLERHDVVLVEGAGGLLVELDQQAATLADLAGSEARFVVVCRAGLGTLNHTMLTLEALRARGKSVAGLVIGSWSEPAGEIERSNLSRLGDLGLPMLAVLPAGVGAHDPASFRRDAAGWLAPGAVEALGELRS